MKYIKKSISKISLFTLFAITMSLLSYNIFGQEVATLESTDEITALKKEISDLEIKKKLLENQLMNVDNEPVEQEDDPACSTLNIIEIQADIDSLESNITKKKAEIAGIDEQIKNMTESNRKLNKNIKGQQDAQLATGIIGGITAAGAIGLGIAGHLKKNEIEKTCSVKAAEQIFENWKMAGYAKQECDRVYRNGYGSSTITSNLFTSCDCCKGGEGSCESQAKALINDYMRSPECTGGQPAQNESAWNGNQNSNQDFTGVDCDNILNQSNNLAHGLVTMVNDEKSRNSYVKFSDEKDCRLTFNKYGDIAYAKISKNVIDINSLNQRLQTECPILCSVNDSNVNADSELKNLANKCLQECQKYNIDLSKLSKTMAFKIDSPELDSNGEETFKKIENQLRTLDNNSNNLSLTLYVAGYADKTCKGLTDEECKNYNGNLSLIRAEYIIKRLMGLNLRNIKIANSDRLLLNQCSTIERQWRDCAIFGGHPKKTNTWLNAQHACGIYGQGSESKTKLSGFGEKAVIITTDQRSENICTPQGPW